MGLSQHKEPGTCRLASLMQTLHLLRPGAQGEPAALTGSMQTPASVGPGQVPPLSGLGFLIYKMRGCTFLYNQHTDLREEKIVILGWQIQHHFYYVYIAVSSRFYEISIYLIYIVIRKE